MIFTPSELQSIKLKSRRDDIIPSPLQLNQKHTLVYSQHKIAPENPNILFEMSSLRDALLDFQCIDILVLIQNRNKRKHHSPPAIYLNTCSRKSFRKRRSLNFTENTTCINT
jgi:hypothetical protein